MGQGKALEWVARLIRHSLTLQTLRQDGLKPGRLPSHNPFSYCIACGMAAKRSNQTVLLWCMGVLVLGALPSSLLNLTARAPALLVFPRNFAR